MPFCSECGCLMKKKPARITRTVLGRMVLVSVETPYDCQRCNLRTVVLERHEERKVRHV